MREDLDEARGAVRALQEDSPPLEDALAGLAGDRGASLDVTGSPRRLGPEISLALYRVAQEALTNVMKHAPGSAVAVKLVFADECVSLSVVDSLPAGVSRATGLRSLPLVVVMGFRGSKSGSCCWEAASRPDRPMTAGG